MSNSSERILLLGLGGVGYHLAKRLSHEGHQLTIIESDPQQLRRADAELDARLVHGDAMSFGSWRRLEGQPLDYLIAVTDNDAVNITASLIATQMGVRQKIARVRSLAVWDDDALLSAADLKIDLVIRPEELAAQEICRLLKLRAGNVRVDVGEGQMQVIATHVTRQSPLCRMLVRDFAENHEDLDFRIVCVARDINTIIPKGDLKLLPDDHAYILAHTRDMPKIMDLVGVSEDRRHRVLVIGGGLIGQRVAELLQGSFPIRLLEQDEQRAAELNHLLRHTECLHGDGAEAETLLQAGLLNTDTIIAATGDNETNIMTSVLAKHLLEHRSGGSKAEHSKTIALVKREEYLVLASAMGADLAVNKKVLAGNEILRYIRRNQVLSVAHLHGCDAEVVELVAEPSAPITRHPLAQIRTGMEQISIGAVHRGDDWEIASGTTHIAPGERVIGICASQNLRELQGLFLS